MATGDRGVARRAKTGGFGGVAVGFATDAPCGGTGSFTVSRSSFAFAEESEISFTDHLCGPHVAPDDINVDFSVGGDNHGSRNAFLHIRAMITPLALKNETVFEEDTFERLPMDRCYAWHSVSGVRSTRNGIGTVM
jgi:hypothetical protein